jgi:acetyl esterase/lipase
LIPPPFVTAFSWLSRGGAVVLFLWLAGGLRAAEANVTELWPEGVPGLRPNATEEKEVDGRFTNIHKPTLVRYAPAADKSLPTAVIYCPGGGYVRVAAGANGGAVTHWLNSIGVTVFLLKYRNVEYGHPAPLQDVLRAIRLVRSRAGEFGLRADRVGMLGGSAGGHLTACAGTLYDAPEGRTGAALDKVSARPDFILLIYPVITMMEPYVHAGSRQALLGNHPSTELLELLSVERHVTRETPPAFLVSTMADTTVPVENALMFYQALRRAKVSAEMHLYPQGTHGSSDPKFGPVSNWPHRAEEWLRFNGWLAKN